VERILVPGWNERSSARAIELAAGLPGLDAAVGVHPHDAARIDERGWARIVAWAGDQRVVAIGETGLDFDRAFSPIADQLANLRRNLALALDTGKPAILHCRSRAGARDAEDALLGELHAAGLGGERWAAVFQGRPPAVVHSFSGSVDFAAAVIDLGLALSFSGLVFRAGEETSAQAARLVPSDRLLVETDSPFLAPPGAPRRRNAPEWVRITASWVAHARGVDEAGLGDALVSAHERAFGRPNR
jgi:TatD DNase family protein